MSSETILAGVAARENTPNPEVVPPAVRRVAASAGAPGDQAVDATTPARRLPLKEDILTLEPVELFEVNCIVEAAPEPAVNVSIRPTF